MTRLITEHQVDQCNRAITIGAGEADPKTGATVDYDVTWFEQDESGFHLELQFQNGPIAEVGTNGITNEVLLAVLIDRLRGFQTGPFACDENHRALLNLMEARDALFERTQARAARGVEGTHAP